MGRPNKYKDDRPGVTSIIGILEKNLQYWYGRLGTQECERIKKQSQEVGHRVHKGIEVYLETRDSEKAQKELKDENESAMLNRFINIIKRKQLISKGSEKVVESELHGYGGTIDYYYKGFIYDWKTDSVPKTKAQERERVYKYKLQLAGYAIALEESEGINVKWGYIIRVSKDLQERIYRIRISEKFRKHFLYLREIYRELKGV